jgi:hypothetical protein
MKKLISILAAVVLFGAFATPALACGSHHGGGTAAKPASYPVCPTKGCTKANLHTHSNKTYAAHHYGDGHDYHDYCDIEGCAAAGYHRHNSTYCFGHAPDDGHDYHDYCGVAGCARTGYHKHGGAYCFAHTPDDGHGYHRAGRGHH